MTLLTLLACATELPPSEVVVSERPWRVTGADWDTLAASLQSAAPRPGAAGRTRVHSTTTCQPGWQSEGVLDVQVSVWVEVEVPEWEQPAHVEPALVGHWHHFAAQVREHELGHAEIARRAALELEDHLLRLPSCRAVFDHADRTFAAVRSDQDRWDKTHGAIVF